MSRRRAPTPPSGAFPPPAHRWQEQPPGRRQQGPVYVQLIGAENLAREVATICSLLPRYPNVTVHAEHGGGGDGDGDDGCSTLPPGVRVRDLPPASRYTLAKIDVDAFPVLRLGVTLCDAHGRLPVLLGPRGAAAPSVWQAVFLLPSGVSPDRFAYALRASGVVSPGTSAGRVTWIAYGGLYHLGFLLKILTGGAPLPDTAGGFLAALRALLGERVFDGRYVAARLLEDVSLEGPLGAVASVLGAPVASAMELWQAGEKNLVACQVFMRIKGLFFAWDGMDQHAGCIHGLH